jgi:hypothetical protein
VYFEDVPDGFTAITESDDSEPVTIIDPGTAAVPEPTTMLLLLAVGAGCGLLRRRRGA